MRWRRLSLTAALTAGALMAAAPEVVPASATATATATEVATAPLAGIVVGIDPGHNGRNYTDPSFMNKQVWNGREWEDCDTTGTQTTGGYADQDAESSRTEQLLTDRFDAGSAQLLLVARSAWAHRVPNDFPSESRAAGSVLVKHRGRSAGTQNVPVEPTSA